MSQTSSPSVATELQLRTIKRAAMAAKIAYHAHRSQEAHDAFYCVMDAYDVTLLRWFAEKGWAPPDLARDADEPPFMSIHVPEDVPGDNGASADAWP